jgi:energy-converting hydrogenase B subunit D
MITALLILLGVTMIAGALLAIQMRNLIAAVIAAGLVSLFASVIYVVLAAPDVAMTEAAIGAGLSTVIFLFALRRTAHEETEEDD